MLRRTLRRIVPTHAILPLCLTGLMNLFAYYGAKLLQCFIAFEARDVTLSLDALFPFSPGWIYVYIGTFLFWIYQYTTVARESPAMACRLACSDAVAKVICFLFFVLLPTTNVRPELEATGLTGFLMRFIWWADTPTNLFPSIHCFVAWMGTRQLYDCHRLRHRGLVCTLCTIGSLLVFLSTLFTRQHVLLDVFGGVAVAELGYLVGRFTTLPERFSRLNDRFVKTKLCAIL